MTTIRRLSDSCITVTGDTGTTLFDPGIHTWESGAVDLDSIGEVQRVLITHEHGDHVNPDFVRWLLDRGSNVTVHANQSVANLLATHDIEVVTANPPGVSAQDVSHGPTPTGATPPNRAYTIDGLFTHPGDSYEPTTTAPILALPLLIPWGSTHQSMEFARRLAPRQVIPVHDFYLTGPGRKWITSTAKQVLGRNGIELVTLDWGESYTV